MTWYTHNFKGQRQDIDSLYKILEFSTLDFAGVFEPDKKLTPQDIVSPSGTIKARSFIGGGRLITCDNDIPFTVQDGSKVYGIRVNTKGEGLNVFSNEVSANTVDTFINTPDFLKTNYGFDEADPLFRPAITYWGQTTGLEDTFIIPLFRTEGKAISTIYTQNVDKDEFLKYLNEENFNKLTTYIQNYCAFANIPEDGSTYNFNLGPKITYDEFGNLVVDSLTINQFRKAKGVVINDDEGKLKTVPYISIENGGTSANNKQLAKKNLGFRYGYSLPVDGEEGDVFFLLVE